MESENAIVLVPEIDNNDHIKLIELNELKLKSSEDFFSDSPQIIGDQVMLNKSPLQSIFYNPSNRENEFYKCKRTIFPTARHDLINLSNIKCLVCNNNVRSNTVNDTYLQNIFKDVHDEKFSETLLTTILSNILQKEISKENTHSEYICSQCYQMVNEWKNISSRLKTIEGILLTLYKETCESLKNEQDIQRIKLEVEEWDSKKESESSCVNGEASSFKIRTKRHRARLKKVRKIPSVALKQNLSLPKTPTQEILKNTNFDEEIQPDDCAARNNEDGKLNGISEALNSEMNDLSVFDVNTNAHSCDSCSFQSSSAAELTKHKQSHYCTICGLFLSYPSQMKTHLVKVHNFSKRFVNSFKLFACNICSKKYSSKGSLLNHKKTVHSETTYTCKECGLTFRHPRLLAVHEVRHQEKKIRCKECDASFFFTADFNKHRNQVHRKIRPYECHKCGHFFCQRSTLTHHLSQHTSHEEPGEAETQAPPSDTRNKSKDSPKTPIIPMVRSGENYTPHVSLEFNLAHQSPAFDEVKDEIEINLNFESPTPSSVTPSVNTYSNQSFDVGSFSFPAESVSSSLANSSVGLPSSLSQAVLRLDTGNRDRFIYPHSALIAPQDVLFSDSFD